MPDIDTLRKLYANNPQTILEIIDDIYDRIDRQGLHPIWISIISHPNARSRAEQLLSLSEQDRTKLSLFGIPFAVKDNIDVAGLRTTGACPKFGCDVASESAPVVIKLQEAGAILIGKTNMDQFATGLVGTRSPYGICSSVFNPKYISGGSSSGSAVAVASGLVTFSLGTDTAGSGRVPAMFNNIIGLKPTRGYLSTRGVLPACRSLDCVSIFAETAHDASIVFDVVRGFDKLDPYSRIPSNLSGTSPWMMASSFRFGIPSGETCQFFGDTLNPQLFQNAIDTIRERFGGEPIEIDLSPFLAVARLLYNGPWVAERYAAVGKFIDENSDDIDPIVHSIIAKAKNYSAADTFNAIYELERLKKMTSVVWDQIDVLIVPTAPRTYTIDEIAAAPIERNSHLGFYTNFVNLLDLAAIAIPAGMRSDDLPFGLTIIGPSFTDDALLSLGDRIHRVLSTHLGGSTRLLAETPPFVSTNNIEKLSNVFLIGVVGAHLTGQPLNYQLTERKARLVRTCRTSTDYHLYALKHVSPIKPGLVKVTKTEKGVGIEVEIWALPVEHVASFIKLIPSPLCIGNIFLDDGSTVKGFLVEPAAVIDAMNISDFGGWRAYLASEKAQ